MRKLDAQTWMSLLEPGFMKIAREMGLGYVRPQLSEETLDLVRADKYGELTQKFQQFLKKFNIPLSDTVM